MQMPGVLKLYFGESNLPTPDFIKQAATQAMAEGFTFYSENAGIPTLRREIADYYGRMHNVDLDPARRMVVTVGGTEAIHLSLRCLVDPGDEAIVLTPAWPNQSAAVRLCSATPVEIASVLENGRYTLDRKAIEAAITPRTRALFYTSPSNPLGWVATDEEQQWLLDLTRERGIWLVADEVYERLYYAGEACRSVLSIARPDDALVVINSFSKNYCMTGWRLGWMIMREDVAMRAGRLQEFFVSHANTFVQKAAEIALRDGEPFLRELKAMLRENRDYCAQALGKMPGVTVPSPDGAFYLFPRIEGLTDSFEFCRQVLLETKVGLAPGVAFGAGGEGSIRMCYAAERHILEEAMQRLGAFVEQHAAALKK